MLQLFLALLSGVLLPFAFAPFKVYTFAYLSLAILLYTWLHASPRQAFSRGFIFGLGMFTTGTSWIYISIHNFGNASVLLSTFITALFVLYLSLFPAVMGFIFRYFFARKALWIRCLCVFPALWVSFEFLRAWLFTGFPWLLVGYTQMETFMRGFAPLLGVYGVSFLVALLSGILVCLGHRTSFKLKIINVLLFFGLFLIGWRLEGHVFTKPVSDPIAVSVVQGNIKQQIKWQADQLKNILAIYNTLTDQHWNSKIIVWPEAAVPALPRQLPDYFKQLSTSAKQHNSAIILGAPIVNDANQYYNGMLVVGNGEGVYLKRHLVPFGEYIPLTWLFAPVMKSFNVPMSDFSKGASEQGSFIANNVPIAPYICYEIAYSIEVLDTIRDNQLIVLITDDSWFGQSIALAQHLQMARMRALETGRYLLACANTGISAIVDNFGKVISQAPINQRLVLTANITPMQGKTPLMIWHYYPLIALVLLLLAFAFFKRNDEK